MTLSSLPTARLKRAQPVFVCKKCLKRVGEAKRLRRGLKDELVRSATASDRKKPRILTTSCFGICPKRAVVVANGDYLSRGEVLLMDPRSVKDIAAALMAGGR